MAITTLFDFLKKKVNPFLKTTTNVSKETITDFISKVSDDIVYAHIVTKYNMEVVTRKELVATLVDIGIDRKFINTHLETLLKIEALQFHGNPICQAKRFVNYCADLMSKWYRESKGERTPFYSEVRNNYFDTDKKCWVIDCWRSKNLDEEGVSPIEVYLDGALKIRDENTFETAIFNFCVIEAIEEVLNEIQSENKG